MEDTGTVAGASSSHGMVRLPGKRVRESHKVVGAFSTALSGGTDTTGRFGRIHSLHERSGQQFPAPLRGGQGAEERVGARADRREVLGADRASLGQRGAHNTPGRVPVTPACRLPCLFHGTDEGAFGGVAEGATPHLPQDLVRCLAHLVGGASAVRLGKYTMQVSPSSRRNALTNSAPHAPSGSTRTVPEDSRDSCGSGPHGRCLGYDGRQPLMIRVSP